MVIFGYCKGMDLWYFNVFVYNLLVFYIIYICMYVRRVNYCVLYGLIGLDRDNKRIKCKINNYFFI